MAKTPDDQYAWRVLRKWTERNTEAAAEIEAILADPWWQRSGIPVPSPANLKSVLITLAGDAGISTEDQDRLTRLELFESIKSAQADGPCGFHQFRTTGRIFKISGGRPWRLLIFLWACPGWTAEVADLADPVFGDREEFVEDEHVRKVQKTLNRDLKGSGYSIGRDGNQIGLAKDSL